MSATPQDVTSNNISITTPAFGIFAETNTSLDKVRKDNEIFHFYATSIVGTLFVILGMVGNILSISVLSSRCMTRGSASICRLLVGLAIYDTVFLFSQGMAGNLIHLLHHAGAKLGSASSVIFVTFYPILHIARTGSVYATVMVTIERCFAVIKPLQAALVFTPARTNKIILTLLVTSIIFNIPRCMENKLVIGSESIIVVKTKYSEHVFFHTIYLIYLNFVIHFALPFTLIAVLNSLMICTFKRVTKDIINKHKNQLLMEDRNKSSHRSSSGNGNRLFATVLAVTSMFFLCHLIPAIGLVLEQTEDADRLGECSPVCSRVSSIGDTLIIVCSATNFILYCLFGRKFRSVFKSIFFPCLVDQRERTGSRRSYVHSIKSLTIVETNA